MNLQYVTVRWEETHEFESKVEVDYDEIHKWLMEDGADDQPITPAVIKDWLESDRDGFEPDRECQDQDFVDSFGMRITRAFLPEEPQ